MEASITQQLVQFIHRFDPDSLTDGVRERTKLALLDCIGVMIAGLEDDAPTVLRRYLEGLGGEPEALVVGARRRLPAEAAAMANAVAAHVLDFDDECPPMIGHPSAPVVPVLLALADLEQSTGREVLGAYVVGLEIEARLGRALNPAHYDHGWHTTSTMGTLGAAAAAARLSRLTPAQIGNCIGIAASRSSGLRRNFGTMTKSLHAGDAASAGVSAARLARAGFTADARIMEAPQGFLPVFAQSHLTPVDFGSDGPLEMERSGIGLKRFPCCGCTHCAIDAVLDLAENPGFSADEVADVLILVSELSPKILTHHNPQTPLEAKFSMEYCVATAIVNREVGLAHFVPDRVMDPKVRAVMPRIRTKVDPSFEVTDGRFATADVTITLHDGQLLRKRVDLHLGHPERPLNQEQVAAKFRDCTQHHLNADAQAVILNEVLNLERAQSLGVLLSALAQVRAPHVAAR